MSIPIYLITPFHLFFFFIAEIVMGTYFQKEHPIYFICHLPSLFLTVHGLVHYIFLTLYLGGMGQGISWVSYPVTFEGFPSDFPTLGTSATYTLWITFFFLVVHLLMEPLKRLPFPCQLSFHSHIHGASNGLQLSLKIWLSTYDFMSLLLWDMVCICTSVFIDPCSNPCEYSDINHTSLFMESYVEGYGGNSEGPMLCTLDLEPTTSSFFFFCHPIKGYFLQHSFCYSMKVLL